MKAAARPAWRPGGRPGRGRARRAGRPRTGPERASQGRAAERGKQPWTEAGRRRVASRPIRRREGRGTRAGQGRRRNRRANAGAEGETLLHPLLSPQVTFRGGRAPPRIHGGGGRRAEGTTPDPSGPGWALGANRPPAGRMTRDGRSGPLLASGAVAGRTVAGGLSSGTVAHRPEGARRPGRGAARGSGSVCPRQRHFGSRERIDGLTSRGRAGR